MCVCVCVCVCGSMCFGVFSSVCSFMGDNGMFGFCFVDSVSVSLFNGISTFVGYLMPKPFSEKNSKGTI